MTAKQRNRLAMYIAINQVFGTYRTELSTVPALVESINEFEPIVKYIQQVHQVQSGYSASSSELKTKEEAEMIQACVQVAAAVYVYAHSNKMPDLVKKVSVSPSGLQGMPDHELVSVCRNILELARGVVDFLGDYGVSGESLTRLESEINDFAVLIGSPRGEIVTRSQATRELKILFSQADDVVKNKLDKLMLLMEMTHAKVYQTYKAARVIVDLKAHKSASEESMEA
ncbi:hypothetical protein [Carboxylicivirga sp. N1Y90]|uniref:hypothetical protein n=1 Tax=Carboxylicivirga fragile TaxID=3417571 RepID=UPI003D34133A|nr:hypothetical protein [Marinilabiliaceae bacterium N1Y90]